MKYRPLYDPPKRKPLSTPPLFTNNIAGSFELMFHCFWLSYMMPLLLFDLID